MYNKNMSKRYPYNKSNSLLKGFTALSCIAFFVAIVLFVGLLAVYHLDSLKGYIDLGELENAVNKIYLRLDAFLAIGFGVSLFGMILSVGLPKAIIREKGGFQAFVLMIISVALIAFYVVLMTSGVKYGYILNYALGGILVVGILGFILGLIAFLTRVRSRSTMARKARKFERNYMKFEKYNR